VLAEFHHSFHHQWNAEWTFDSTKNCTWFSTKRLLLELEANASGPPKGHFSLVLASAMG
jgi:hypothetical protein